MPIVPEIDEEVVDIAPQTIAPPATVAQQSQVPAYANDVYQGPSTFKTFAGYQSAWEQAARDAIAQRAQDAQLREVLANSTAVEDQLKAIQQAKQFVQMRKFGSDLQAATASGLPPEQALATSLARNPGAVLGNLSASSSVFRNAGRSMQPQVPLGSVKKLKDPVTGKEIGVYQSAQETLRPFPVQTENLSPSQQANTLTALLKHNETLIANSDVPSEQEELKKENKIIRDKLKKYVNLIDQTQTNPPPAFEGQQTVVQPDDKVQIMNKKTNKKGWTSRSNAQQLTPDSDWVILK